MVLALPKPVNKSKTKKDKQTDSHTINFPDKIKKSVQEISDTKSKLERYRKSDRERSRKYAKKKRASGYVRKTFWLNLSPEDSSLFLVWLRKQDSQSLIDVTNADVKLSHLLSIYDNYPVKKVN